MAGIKLYKCCHRENEEEVADQWCNDCSEAIVEYDKIEKQTADNIKQSMHSRKDLQENMDWLCTLENSSLEYNIFHAVKHLETILVSSENQIDRMKNDLVTVPLCVLPPEGIKKKTFYFEIMASVELCQCCLRENEEEVADLWCNDCSETVCRNCGKAHRRFAVAHDVISISDAPTCRKAILKYCLSHDNKKFHSVLCWTRSDNLS
ncbi:unnamed protein product [Mytilus edulis]|uniref:B box-type domain-containing protein n=1 Tax=Mytilus edulis TaxID=6550 RepID=A0A8S3UI27_MYTED|nr:unnamed protein product [Mytilus edulis]